MNGGLAQERPSASEAVGDRSAKGASRVGLTPDMGEDRRKARGGERSSSSGYDIAKSGEVVAGPGL